VLRDPQGRPAAPRARGVPRLGCRCAARPEPGDALRDPRDPAGDGLQGCGRGAGQAQSAGQLELRAGLALHPRARRALQRAALARLRLDRLRALHASRPSRRARARRPLVVGGGDPARVRPARRPEQHRGRRYFAGPGPGPLSRARATRPSLGFASLRAFQRREPRR
jgi:hypothetical protein